ncbi:hypothetical protein GWN63_05590 [Candidatus Bathyarchaeota archaeon]|nr:hypothetical protein [Candidatus Bathyarchaeota archaeon]NIR17929.1 hypothetical protein [Desulfobacterales bacterium]NIU81695.1 hypothetical protein [Candidatus Bathyarchaeota archaeon]NIV68292.1 hypothetical protein [Candidatus Bathyarchaeota archaeon]NIW34191.1 hypothetical protein [Candidatus Bathyarchaeota archaeon]
MSETAKENSLILKQGRQGDVLLEKVKRPKNLSKTRRPWNGSSVVLAWGETTGHAHAIYDTEGLSTYEDKNGTLYLTVEKPVDLVHGTPGKNGEDKDHYLGTLTPTAPDEAWEYVPQQEFDWLTQSLRRVSD